MYVKQALKIWWCCFCTFMLVIGLTESFWENIIGLLDITGWMLLKNLFVILVFVLVAVSLYKLCPILRWSWICLFKDKEESEDGEKEMNGGNIWLFPARVKYFGLFFILLFILNLPQFALAEEEWFREGIQNWREGILMSVLFGMIHCLVGVPLAIGLALIISGMWFTHQYFIGGIELSTLHHTSYNLIVLSVLFLILLAEQFFKPRDKKELTRE